MARYSANPGSKSSIHRSVGLCELTASLHKAGLIVAEGVHGVLAILGMVSQYPLSIVRNNAENAVVALRQILYAFWDESLSGRRSRETLSGCYKVESKEHSSNRRMR